MEDLPMLSPETLLMLGAGSVLPYIAEAVWHWSRHRKSHRTGANRQPD